MYETPVNQASKTFYISWRRIKDFNALGVLSVTAM
jgi:hypothetical protein